MVEKWVRRYEDARRDDGLVVLEGLHALKHCARFGGEPFAIVTPDLAALQTLTAEVAPDLARVVDGAGPPGPDGSG